MKTYLLFFLKIIICIFAVLSLWQAACVFGDNSDGTISNFIDRSPSEVTRLFQTVSQSLIICVLILFYIFAGFIYPIENRHYSPMVSLTPTPSQLIEMIKAKEADEDDENVSELATTIQTHLFDENYCKTYGGVILLKLFYVLETDDELMKLVFHDKNSMEWVFYALTVQEPTGYDT